MEPLALWLAGIGIFGLALSTVVIPCAVALVNLPSLLASYFHKPKRTALGFSRGVAIVIPVYNDVILLQKTLSSLAVASRKAVDSLSGAVRVLVVADGCSDDTARVAREFGAEVLVNTTNVGKWQSLRRGVSHLIGETVGTTADGHPEWIAFVDTGVEWPANFLDGLASHLEDSRNVCVAPAYKDHNGSQLGKIQWLLEATLKMLESVGRGPVSVHGATVLYRAKPLVSAFENLGDEQWLNDDVVLPLMVRSLDRSGRVKFVRRVAVFDRSPRICGRATAQRSRMMRGNLQWMSALLPSVLRRDLGTFIVATRRVARVFWAYWISFIVVGASLFLANSSCVSESARTFTFGVNQAGAVLGSLVFSAAIILMLCRLSAAARASLRAPLTLFTAVDLFRGVQWR